MSLDSDIIHPRVQGSSEAEFYEKWEDRKAKKRVIAPKPRQNGPFPKIHSDVDVVTFKRLYASGMSLKNIGAHFGICDETVRRKATKLGLKRVRQINSDAEHYVSLNIRLTLRDFLRLKKYAGKRQGGMGAFVRSAVLYKLDGVSA